MHATGGFQCFIHERLCAETDAVDSRYQPVDSFLDINGLRVRLQCYFFQNTEESLSQGMNHAGKKFRQKKTRRTSADVNGMPRNRARPIFPATLPSQNPWSNARPQRAEAPDDSEFPDKRPPYTAQSGLTTPHPCEICSRCTSSGRTEPDKLQKLPSLKTVAQHRECAAP